MTLLHRLTVLLILSCLCSSVACAAPTVLFDEGHAQQFLIGSNRALDLSGLAQAYREQGFEVINSTGKITDEVLSDVDVLVISGAFMPLSSTELQRVLDFIDAGGGLAIMLHIAPPLRDLLHTLDVDYTNGTLRETSGLIEGNPLDFAITRFKGHPVTKNLSSFSVYGAWALRNTAEHTRIIAETSEHGWVDLDRNKRLTVNDAVQAFGVLVAGELGRGRYVVLGDDAAFQNRFFDQDNRQLAIGILEWLGE